MTGISKFQISRSLDEKIKRIILGSSESLDQEYAQVSSAYILGFNYGNVTNCVAITTNYQLHHAVFPVVGLVYFKTAPDDEEIQANLRSIKEYSSSPNGLGSFKSDKNEHLFLIYSAQQQQPQQSDNNSKSTTNNVNGSQYKPPEIEKRLFNLNKGTFVRRKRLRLVVLNDPFTPRQVYSGTEDLFDLDDVDSLDSAEDDQFDHLIFFIHGVGGVCDSRFRSCVEVVADFKKMANDLLQQHSNPSSGASTPTNRHLVKHLRKGFFRKQSQDSSRSSSGDTNGGDNDDQSSRDLNSPPPPSSTQQQQRQRNNRLARRVECLPVSWHSLTRRQTGITDQLSLIALNSVPKLRNFIDKVVLDALLYSSGPCYTQTIINNVGNEINRLYTLFMEKHPNFTGSVSLAGHSLGSVIMFDLLAHQIPSMNNEENNNQHHQQQQQQQNNNNNNDAQQPINTRGNCRNVGHHHHNIMAPQTTGPPKYCSDYSSLEELLKDMNLTDFADLFHKEHIDLNSLLLLTDFDMKELQLPLGARRKLGTYINFKKVPQLQPQYDFSTNNNNNTQQQAYNPMCNMNTGQFLVEFPQLKFTPRCFFAFGSPTPMFLNIRGIQSLSCDYKLPTCERMLNIYHPYDPLAYRMEPLIDPRFKHVEPILLPHHRGGKRIHVQLREGFARVGHDIKHRLLGSLRNTWSSFTRITPPDQAAHHHHHHHNHHEQAAATMTATSLSSTDNNTGSSSSQSLDDDDELLGEGAEAAAILRRRKLMKSQSSAATATTTTTSSMEFKSAESSIQSLMRPDQEALSGPLEGGNDNLLPSPSSTGGSSVVSSPPLPEAGSGTTTTASKPARKPLKRQQHEFRRSQSETSKTMTMTAKATVTTTTTNDLNSILEASFHDALQNLTGLDQQPEKRAELDLKATASSSSPTVALGERLGTLNLESTSSQQEQPDSTKNDVTGANKDGDAEGQNRSCFAKKLEKAISFDEADDGGKRKTEQQQQQQQQGPDSPDDMNDFDTTKIGRLNMGRRIDYVLQEKPIELFNEYIFVATSHANYWQQEDSALLILKELYQVDNIQLFDQTD